MLRMIDNDEGFTFNLVQSLRALGRGAEVERSLYSGAGRGDGQRPRAVPRDRRGDEGTVDVQGEALR